MAIKVVAQGQIVQWLSSFSNPVVPASYQQGDFIVVMVMINGSLTSYTPTGFTRMGLVTSSDLTLFYRKMTSNGSNLTLSGLSGKGAMGYLIVRGADRVIQAGNTDGSAKNITTPAIGQFVIVTTGNSSGLEFQDAGYSVLPSQWGTNTNYYTVAYKTITGSFYIPSHKLWGGNENYIVFTSDNIDFKTETWNFGYTGNYQTFIAPITGTYTLEVWGAQGGGKLSGKGGYSRGDMILQGGSTAYIYVGGQGGTGNSPGWNGGAGTTSGSDYSGGGGTDIRVGGNGWNNRVIVAGGGGGGTNSNGGAGGGILGISGGAYGSGYLPGGGGTQSSGGLSGTSSSFVAYAGSLGTGGRGFGNSGAGGGGGYYGGGGGVHWGGGGGSGYIGSLANAQTINGDTSMPIPNGSGSTYGNSGHGYAIISFISYANYQHYFIKQDGKYFIPNAKFYNQESKAFIPQTLSFLSNIKANRTNFFTDLSDIFTKKIELPGESFYIHEKFSDFQIIKLAGYIDSLPYKAIPNGGIRFFHRFTRKYLERTSVTIKDAFSNVKDIYQYFIDIENTPPARIGIVKDEICYGKDYKIIDCEEIIDKGFEPVDLKGQYIDFDNFKIIFMFYDTPSIKSNYLKTFKINKKIGNTNRIMTDEEYKIYHKKDNEHSYIGIVNEIEKVSLNKLGNTTEYLRIDSLEEF